MSCNGSAALRAPKAQSLNRKLLIQELGVVTLKIPHGGPWGPWVYTGDGKVIVGVLS